MLSKSIKILAVCVLVTALSGCYIIQPAAGTSVTIQNPNRS